MIGRIAEIDVLNKLCDDKKSRFGVIHGRRRIGKTYLVEKMFQDKRPECMYFEVTAESQPSKEGQIRNFLYKIKHWCGIQPDNMKNVKEWRDVFELLRVGILSQIEKYNHTEKIVVFIDEVAWYDRHNKDGFLSAVGHFWNDFCNKRDDFILILCGSHASWIKNNVLNDGTDSLRARVDRSIQMLPFTLKETKQFLINEKNFDIDDKTVMDYYMILGGVAKYLDYLDGDEGLAENIDRIVFDANGRMFKEFDLLFESLFHIDEHNYKTVINELCEVKSGVTKTNLSKVIDSRKLSVILTDLESCGFIRGLNKHGNKSREEKYIITDPYCLFHKKWVEGLTESDLIRGKDFWQRIYSDRGFTSWSGTAFEIACIINIDAYAKRRGRFATLKSASYWAHTKDRKDPDDEGAQIDILIEYENNLFEIVECKYDKGFFVINSDYAKDLQRKKDVFIKKYFNATSRYTVNIVMLTTFGTKRNAAYSSLNIAGDVMLADMFEN